MTMLTATLLQDSQVFRLKGFQEACGRWLRGRPFGVSYIQPCQMSAICPQATACDRLQ
jgi:hypothetical protein